MNPQVKITATGNHSEVTFNYIKITKHRLYTKEVNKSEFVCFLGLLDWEFLMTIVLVVRDSLLYSEVKGLIRSLCLNSMCKFRNVTFKMWIREFDVVESKVILTWMNYLKHLYKGWIQVYRHLSIVNLYTSYYGLLELISIYSFY